MHGSDAAATSVSALDCVSGTDAEQDEQISAAYFSQVAHLHHHNRLLLQELHVHQLHLARVQDGGVRHMALQCVQREGSG